jgi:hypothetical protein
MYGTKRITQKFTVLIATMLRGPLRMSQWLVGGFSL